MRPLYMSIRRKYRLENNKKTPEQEFVESIGMMLDNGMAITDKILTGVVKSIDGKKATLSVNGQDQTVAICSPEITVGSISRVFVPDNNMSNAFIIGKTDGVEQKIPKIVTSYYIGNGKYGQYNPNTLTFDFRPSFIIIRPRASTSSYMLFNGVTSLMVQSGLTTTSLTVLWGDNTVSWYYPSTGGGGDYGNYQLNSNGAYYDYFAIG